MIRSCTKSSVGIASAADGLAAINLAIAIDRYR